MNAPPREIPIIDLWTGLPWVAEAETDSMRDAPREHPADAVISAEKPTRLVSTGPRIAPHRQMDAAALDLADVREEHRRGCRNCRKQAAD